MTDLSKLTRITLAYGECSSAELRFPANREELLQYISMESNQLTGKELHLASCYDKYYTTDELEIEFASRCLSMVRVAPASDADLLEVFRKPDHFPHIYQPLTEQEAAKFLFKDPSEDRVREKLIELGYLLSPEEDEESTGETPEAPESPSIDSLTDEQLIQMLRDRGYVGMRKSEKKE